jgi:hypothetical protein
MNTEEGSSDQGSEHDQGSWGDHLTKSSLSGDGDASVVIWTKGGSFNEETWTFLVLSLDLVNHLHGSLTHRLHGQGREPVGEHGADEKEGKGQRMKDLNADTGVKTGVHLSSLDSDNKGTVESKGDKSSTSDCESLSNSSSGVS